MFNKIIYYIRKYEGILLYLIFGVLTTLINMVVYYIFFTRFHFANIVSNTIAWVTAVAFAFMTNKVWVFKSKSFEVKLILKELSTFVLARLATLGLDTAIMVIGVDLLKGNPIISKTISNVFIVVLNYIFSKLIIFRKKNTKIHVKRL